MPQGLLWVNSRITSPSLSKSTFEEWYNEEHIPDVFHTKKITSACRYHNISASESHQYLALYPVKDVNFLGSKEFHAIPDTSKKYFPGGEKCFHHAEFDTRFYEWIDEFAKPGVKSGMFNSIFHFQLDLILTPSVRSSKPHNLRRTYPRQRNRRRLRRLVQRRTLRYPNRLSRLYSHSSI